jgi:hypothetical protein
MDPFAVFIQLQHYAASRLLESISWKGLGNATFSYENMAPNAVYAIGETHRMLHEIGMQRAGANGIFKWAATSWSSVPASYVPLLVFGGLLSCLCTFLIPVGLLAYPLRKKSCSLRIWRKVNVARLLADALDGLRDEDDFDRLSGLDNTALGDWSKSYSVRYVKKIDGNGITIKAKEKQVVRAHFAFRTLTILSQSVWLVLFLYCV